MPYFDLNTNLTWDETAIRDSVHQFALEVIRPAAKKLDKMTAEEVVAQGSPLYDVLKQAYALGYHKVFFPETMGGPGFSQLQKAIFFEELAWGSMGIAITLAVVGFPFYFMVASGNQEMIDRFVTPFLECSDGSIRGCWAITEPNHGTDVMSTSDPLLCRPGVRGDCRAAEDGDSWVINGQKSAWVSGGTIATHCLLHLQFDDSMGLAGSGIAMVPCDLPGVSKGAPTEKIGQRDLNQGEIFFDNVRIPKEYVIMGPDMYQMAMSMILGTANMIMGICSTGLARAAFDEAFAWSKERVQGGKGLIEHDSMKARVFTMFARVESCRALSRAVANVNFDNTLPATEYSVASKVTNTELCFQNANDAMQIFGGYGLTREYPVEKLFRDARACLIEDGCNEMLAKKAGYFLLDTYPRLNDVS